MIYEGKKGYVISQNQKKDIKLKESIKKQEKKEQSGYWIKVDRKTVKWVRNNLSENEGKRIYNEHRDNWYQNERLRRPNNED